MLAIVIPYYKLKFFEATLKSLSNQSDKRFKVYIGDDASPDHPTRLIKEHEKQIELVYKRFENNLGGISLIKQWERCIEMTTDERWIMVLGDDDVLDVNVVQLWYQNFNTFNKHSNVIRFATRMIYEKNQTISKLYIHPEWEYSECSYHRKLKFATRSSLSEYIFLKESWATHKFYDYPLAWHSDDRAWLEFSEDLPIYTINEGVVYIRDSNVSISGKQDNIHVKRTASAMFYKFLVDQKLNRFEKFQRFDIVKGYLERTLNVRQFTFKEWCFLWIWHLRNYNVKSFYKFLMTFVKALIKRK
ncbi:glycosyltransferase [Gelidibacter salicanalis]|uniref:Glycosyltransferase n=1 Tax=Gelidibacter salicanalis TaxID=291193 RepID=A0A934KK71_9FLAO|nr:glycosyltransferase [Gelidibacter salicanalis]MBJ7880582.1 glycosyltransferase [Gelidibacter salicanalis]